MSDTQTLALEQQGPVLHLTLNRPDVRNAMSLTMVQELHAVFDQIENDPEVRIVVIRGAGGHFCAGGDIKDMAEARGQKRDGDEDPFFTLNRAFGRGYLDEQNDPILDYVINLDGGVTIRNLDDSFEWWRAIVAEFAEELDPEPRPE